MSLRASDVKRTRAEQVPYTPPAARRSARAPSDHAEGYNAGATPRAPQCKLSPSEQLTNPGDEAARRRPAGTTKASTVTVARKCSSNNTPPVQANTQTATTGVLAAPAAAQQPTAATLETRPKKGLREDELSSAPRVGSTRDPSDHPAPPTSNQKNAPEAAAGAASRRKPRQAWAQYVPPSRRGGETSSSDTTPSSSSTAASCGKSEDTHSFSADADLRTAAARDPRGRKFSPSKVVRNCPASKEKKAIPPHPIGEVALERRRAPDEEGPESEVKIVGEETTEPVEETVTSLPPSDAEGVDTHAKVVSTSQETEADPAVLAESSGGLSRLTSSESTASPTRDAPSKRQPDDEPILPAPAPASVTCPDATGDDHDQEVGSNGDDRHRDQAPELPALKPPSARYIPPGRRKALDTEAAAAAAAGRDSNGGGAAAGDGIGPLWASRAPVRVSQRERPSNKDAEPAARPSPSRVAGVVSGGMSAYGANISEYSEEMSREQVEACTAVVSNFPAALPPGQRAPMLQSFVALGGLVV
ncbi:unnamed protein product [Hapterophycus canaliculatus]